MKTIIAILVFAAFSAKAQFISVKCASPVLCPGDSIVVDFSFNGQPGMSDFVLKNPAYIHVWNVANSEFYCLPKVLIGADTIYSIRLKTKEWWPMGESFMSDWTSQVGVSFECGVTGIAEISQNDTEPIYFDVYGNRTSFTPGKILIEKRGNKIRKVVYD